MCPRDPPACSVWQQAPPILCSTGMLTLGQSQRRWTWRSGPEGRGGGLCLCAVWGRHSPLITGCVAAPPCPHLPVGAGLPGVVFTFPVGRGPHRVTKERTRVPPPPLRRLPEVPFSLSLRLAGPLWVLGPDDTTSPGVPPSVNPAVPHPQWARSSCVFSLLSPLLYFHQVLFGPATSCLVT